MTAADPGLTLTLGWGGPRAPVLGMGALPAPPTAAAGFQASMRRRHRHRVDLQ